MPKVSTGEEEEPKLGEVKKEKFRPKLKLEDIHSNPYIVCDDESCDKWSPSSS